MAEILNRCTVPKTASIVSKEGVLCMLNYYANQAKPCAFYLHICRPWAAVWVAVSLSVYPF